MQDGRGPRSRRLTYVLALAAVALFVIHRWAGVTAENINWDEFAFLERAYQSLRTGDLIGGGRPGLALLMLMPFAKNCVNSIDALVDARTLWLGLTLVYLVGVFALVDVLNHARGDRTGAVVAVVLLALSPAFLRWSLQVRADQPALMFAVWGAVALVSSKRRTWMSLLAGVLFALGFLCSQKALYVMGLGATLLACELSPGLKPSWATLRRAALLLGLAGVACAAIVAAFSPLVSVLYRPAASTSIADGFSASGYYRALFGYRAYWAMLPGLTTHLLLLAAFLRATFLAPPVAPGHRFALIHGWAILLLGYIVGAIHAGAFPYFWMTLGLFPAVAFGLAWPAIFASMPVAWRPWFVAVAAVILGTTAITYATSLLPGTQHVQREALAFVERAFPGGRGFHTEGALICRPDPNPFPVYFTETIERQFTGPEGPARMQAFITEFRDRPVSFMIAHRLYRFPEPIDTFWNTHYVDYRDEVMVPGQRLTGVAGHAVTFDVIVPGTYRWLAEPAPQARLVVDADTVSSGGTITLGVGLHRLRLVDDVSLGLFALQLADPPGEVRGDFYDARAVLELAPPR